MAAAAEEERIAEDDVDVGAVSEAASLPASAARRERGDISELLRNSKRVCFPFFFVSRSSSLLFAIIPCFFPLSLPFLSLSLCFARSLFPLRGVQGAHEIPDAYTQSERENSSALVENGGGNGGEASLGRQRHRRRRQTRRPPKRCPGLGVPRLPLRPSLLLRARVSVSAAMVRAQIGPDLTSERVAELVRSVLCQRARKERKGRKHSKKRQNHRVARGEPFTSFSLPASSLRRCLLPAPLADKISSSCSQFRN